MALIRYFLVPPKQTSPHWTCSHYPSSHSRSWRLLQKKYPHNNSDCFRPLNCSPGRDLCPNSPPSPCCKYTQIHTHIIWPQFVTTVASISVSHQYHSVYALPRPITSLCSDLQADLWWADPPLTSPPCPPPHYPLTLVSVSTPHYKSDGSLMLPIRLSEAAASILICGHPSLWQKGEEGGG